MIPVCFSWMNALTLTLLIIQTFLKCSGLRINQDKSEVIWISALRKEDIMNANYLCLCVQIGAGCTLTRHTNLY